MSFIILVLHLLIHFLICLVPCLDYISWGPPPLPPNPSKEFMVCYYVCVASNPFEFLHYYFCAPCNMATFHAFRHSNLTIMVDDLGMAVVF